MSTSVQTIDLPLRSERPLVHLVGQEAVQQQSAILARLARRSGMAGCVDHLHHFHSNPYFGTKRPNLLLLGTQARTNAAVLVHEYRAAGVPLRLFIPEDAWGERTVIAPPEERAAVACQAARYLLRQGALVAMLSFGCGEAEDVSELVAAHRSELRVTRKRILRRDLILESSLDETFARMGAHTR